MEARKSLSQAAAQGAAVFIHKVETVTPENPSGEAPYYLVDHLDTGGDGTGYLATARAQAPTGGHIIGAWYEGIRAWGYVAQRVRSPMRYVPPVGFMWGPTA